MGGRLPDLPVIDEQVARQFAEASRRAGYILSPEAITSLETGNQLLRHAFPSLHPKFSSAAQFSAMQLVDKRLDGTAGLVSLRRSFADDQIAAQLAMEIFLQWRSLISSVLDGSVSTGPKDQFEKYFCSWFCFKVCPRVDPMLLVVEVWNRKMI
nr:hypothetical protein Iba_chr07eCG9380 [Ipomoea batatas]